MTCAAKTIFEYWANYDNFPFFMKHVRRVHDCGLGRSHWTVGEAGWEELADYALSWALEHTAALNAR